MVPNDGSRNLARLMNPQTRPALVCGIEDIVRKGKLSGGEGRMNPQTRPARN